jgi:hypothetical protein
MTCWPRTARIAGSGTKFAGAKAGTVGDQRSLAGDLGKGADLALHDVPAGGLQPLHQVGEGHVHVHQRHRDAPGGGDSWR